MLKELITATNNVIVDTANETVKFEVGKTYYAADFDGEWSEDAPVIVKTLNVIKRTAKTLTAIDENGSQVLKRISLAYAGTKETVVISGVNDITAQTVHIYSDKEYTPAVAAAPTDRFNAWIEAITNADKVKAEPQCAWEDPHNYETVGNLNGECRSYNFDADNYANVILAATVDQYAVTNAALEVATYTEIRNAEIASGTYSIDINGEYVSFKNFSIVRIDATRERQMFLEKDCKGRNRFYQFNPGHGQNHDGADDSMTRISARAVAENYMAKEAAKEQGKKFAAFFAPYRTRGVHEFTVHVYLTYVDKREHHFTGEFNQYRQVQQFISDVKAFVGDTPCQFFTKTRDHSGDDKPVWENPHDYETVGANHARNLNTALKDLVDELQNITATVKRAWGTFRSTVGIYPQDDSRLDFRNHCEHLTINVGESNFTIQDKWYGTFFARYNTFAQVETVVTRLKDVFTNGKTEFTFPTVEELTAPPEPELPATVEETDREKFLKAKEHIKAASDKLLANGHFTTKWLVYDEIDGWKRTNKATAAAILSQFGLDIFTYLAEKENWIADEVSRSAINAAAEEFAAAIVAPAKILALPAPAAEIVETENAEKQQADDEDADYKRSVEIVGLCRRRDAVKAELADTDEIFKGARECGDTETLKKLGKERWELNKIILACTKRLRELGAIPEPKVTPVDDFEPEPDTPEPADAEVTVEERKLTRRESLELDKKIVMAEIDEYREGLIEYKDDPDVNPTHIDFLQSSIDRLLNEYYDICRQLDELDDNPPAPKVTLPSTLPALETERITVATESGAWNIISQRFSGNFIPGELCECWDGTATAVFHNGDLRLEVFSVDGTVINFAVKNIGDPRPFLHIDIDATNPPAATEPVEIPAPLNFAAKILHDKGCVDARFATYDEAYVWIKDQENLVRHFESEISFFNSETLDREILYRNANSKPNPPAEPPKPETPVEPAPVDDNPPVTEIPALPAPDSPCAIANNLTDILQNTFRGVDYMDFTAQDGAKEISYPGNLHVEPDWENDSGYVFANGYAAFARYETPEQVIDVMTALRDAINDGKTEFTFPTVDELNAPPEPELTDREKFLRAKKVVSTKPGRYLGNGKYAITWRYLNSVDDWEKISKKTAAVILAEFGLTTDTYLAEKAKWVAEEIERGSRQFAIDMQAEFLRDKIDADRKASVEPMPALVPADDSDADDELIDPPEVKAPVDDFTAKLAAFDTDVARAETDLHVAKFALRNAEDAYQTAIAARQDFLDKTAGDLTRKLHEPCVGIHCMETTTLSGCRALIGNLYNIYVDATLNGQFTFVNSNNREFARYDTPAQVELVIARLKDAADHHEPVFYFPTVKELNMPVEERDARYNRGVKIAEDLTAEPHPIDPIVEVTFGFNEYGEDTYYLTYNGIRRGILPADMVLKISSKARLADKPKPVDDRAALEARLAECQAKERTKWQILCEACDNYDAKKKAVDDALADDTYDGDGYSALEDELSDAESQMATTYELWTRANNAMCDAERDLEEYDRKVEHISDSLTRAMNTALEYYKGFCHNGNLTKAEYELKLYNICRKAKATL